jgi:hypothetical protein
LATLAAVLATSFHVAWPGSAGASSPGGPAVTRSGHIAYLGCRAADVVLRVSVPHSSYGPGQPVRYRVSLHNVSAHSCTAPGAPARASNAPVSELLGPCGQLSVVVDNAHGLDVYPGPEAISCPAYLGPVLAAHGTLAASGTWDQSEGPLIGGRLHSHVIRHAPPGRYRIMIGGAVSVAVTLVP